MTLHRSLFFIALSVIVTSISGVVSADDDLNFRDDFVGSTLSPAFRVLNVDKDRYALVDQDYLLLVTHEDTKNTIQYVKPLPENFSVTIRVAEPPVYDNQVFRIRIGELDRNIRLGMFANPGGNDNTFPRLIAPRNENTGDVRFASVKTIDSEDSTPIILGADLFQKPFYLRIDKRGVEYEMRYSDNGTRWYSVGTQVMINITPQVFFETYNGNTAPETAVKVDSFEVMSLQ